MSKQQGLNRNNLKKIYDNNMEMITLYETDEYKLILLATCGGIGLFEVFLPLDDFETEQYHSKGEGYLKSVSYDVCKNLETKYKERIIPAQFSFFTI